MPSRSPAKTITRSQATARKVPKTDTVERSYSPGTPLPDNLLTHQAKALSLKGPTHLGPSASHVSHRNRGQHLKRGKGTGKGTGLDWRSNPRSSNPHYVSKAAQTSLKSARISFIQDLMARDEWDPKWIPYLGREWAGHCKPPSQEVYVRQLSAVAHRLVAASFQPQELVRKIHVRHETAARHCMQVGTMTAYRTMARLHETQLKMAGVDKHSPVQAPAPVTNNVQIYQAGDGSTRVKMPTMKALFRGRALPPLTTPTVVDTEGSPSPED